MPADEITACYDPDHSSLLPEIRCVMRREGPAALQHAVSWRVRRTSSATADAFVVSL